jgi:MFS family permease
VIRFQNVRGVSPLVCTLYFLPDAGFGTLTALLMARLIPRVHARILCLAGILFLLAAPLLMATSPAQQSYWPQAFPAVCLSAVGGMILFNVSNVFVSSSVKKELQGLGQGIFNTIVQIGTAISLALAATIANAGGVTAGADVDDLLHGYRMCFWFSAGLLAIPFVLTFFLRKGVASDSPEQVEEKRKEREKEEAEKKVEKEAAKKVKTEGEIQGGEQVDAKVGEEKNLRGDEITTVDGISEENTEDVKLQE